MMVKADLSRQSQVSEATAPAAAPARLAVFCVVLFLSGTAALIFETLWLRLSGLAFGNSVWAAALILSSFMAGLALGNAIAASSRIQSLRPIRFYALLEVLVAFLGCTIVFALPALGALLRPVWQTLWNYQPALLGLRFVVSFLILLVPTTAMGLTLPVLMEDPVLRPINFGRALGFLYGFNTLGAVAGAVLGEAWLVRAFGLRGTGLTAGIMNCIAAAIALLVARGEAAPGRARRQSESGHSLFFPLRFTADYRPPWRLLCVSFGTGCILLALEVIWFRFLRLYVASTPTAFAIMLAVVLAGIGLGGVLAGATQCLAGRPGNHFLSLLLMLAAIVTLLCYIFFPGGLAYGEAVFDLEWWRIALLCVALMFPAALLSGVMFPTIVAEVQATVGDRMNSVGVTTLLNTTGAAIGPIVASFALLPSVGFQSSLIACAVAYACLSLVADGAFSRQTGLGKSKEKKGERSWTIQLSSFFASKNALVRVGLWAALIVILATFPDRRARAHLAHAAHPYQVTEQGNALARVVQTIEGSSGTYQLLRRDLFGQPYYYRLLTDAFSMSATNPHNQRYMRLFAYLPLALRPESEEVLLLCYGCGVTADALLHGPNVKRMDVVDISREVFRLADFYTGINYSNPLRDSRAHPVIQDARFFLQATPRQYDIITGEPPPPKIAGSVNLYTQEFFALIRRRLKPGGITTFWLPVGQLKVQEAKAILRAFHKVFPNTVVWASADQEWIMMGINGAGVPVRESELRGLWNKAMGEDLRQIGVEVPQQLPALFVMDGAEIDRISRDVAPLMDNYPKRLTDQGWDEEASLEFTSPYMEALPAFDRFKSSTLMNHIWPKALSDSLESFFAVRQMRYVSETAGSNELEELDIYLRHSHLRIPVLEVLGSDVMRLTIARRLAKQSKLPPVETLQDLLAGTLAQRNFSAAVRLLEEKRERARPTEMDVLLLIYLWCLSGDVPKAEAVAATEAAFIKHDGFVNWLWVKLEREFGFHPPR